MAAGCCCSLQLQLRIVSHLSHLIDSIMTNDVMNLAYTNTDSIRKKGNDLKMKFDKLIIKPNIKCVRSLNTSLINVTVKTLIQRTM